MSADGHDTWHEHTTEEGAPQEEHGAQASPKALGMVLIAMVVSVIFVILILKVFFDTYMSSYQAKVEENTTAAAETWQWKQDILGNMAPSVAQATQAVIEEYSSN